MKLIIFLGGQLSKDQENESLVALCNVCLLLFPRALTQSNLRLQWAFGSM